MDVIFEHRSIRSYKSKPIEDDVLARVLLAGTRASSVGNMQLYSVVVTTDEQIKKELLPCHFGQPMVVQAPVVMTFCADINRFSAWCELRGATPEYDNFMWFVNGAIDALLASQNISLEAEANGLGICYLGTTTYTADKICDVLDLPNGVIPVTTIVMGYPNENPPLTDRLPLDGVIHREKYKNYSADDLNTIWFERESSQETTELIKFNELPNLARIFTEKRYKGSDNIQFSKVYLELLKKQGFMNQ